MEFTLEMDRPIVKGSHYISPGGYELRFVKKGGLGVDIQFDFLDYEGTIEGKLLHCRVSELDTYSFRNADDVFKWLDSGITPVWNEFYVYTGEDDEPDIYPVKAFNIKLYNGGKVYNLPDYTVRGSKIGLTTQMYSDLSSLLSKAVRFCKSRQMYSSGNIQFYERDGRVFLCSKIGNGYFYEVSTGSVGSVGFKGSQGSLDVVKTIILGILGSLNTVVDFPIKSIQISLGKEDAGGYLVESVEEPGSFDIYLFL
jgi:hypothetical protein